MMGDYFSDSESTSRSYMNPRLPAITALPITPVATSQWEVVTDPRRLHKKFEFNSHNDYVNFISEILIYEKATDHSAKLTCEYPSIVIEVYTHDVDDITELDQDYAKMADQIFDDILNYGDEEVYYEY